MNKLHKDLKVLTHDLFKQFLMPYLNIFLHFLIILIFYNNIQDDCKLKPINSYVFHFYFHKVIPNKKEKL